MKVGDKLIGGDIISEVEETKAVIHKVILPPNVSGEIISITDGEFTIVDEVAKIKTSDNEIVEITMLQKWPVRKGRPYKNKLSPSQPMVTGQRVIHYFQLQLDSSNSGPFGSGKTVQQPTNKG